MWLDERNSSAAAKSKAPPIVGDVCTRRMGPDYEHCRHSTDHCSKAARQPKQIAAGSWREVRAQRLGRRSSE